MMARSSKAVHPSLLARLLVEPKTGSEPFARVPWVAWGGRGWGRRKPYAEATSRASQ